MYNGFSVRTGGLPESCVRTCTLVCVSLCVTLKTLPKGCHCVFLQSASRPDSGVGLELEGRGGVVPDLGDPRGTG